MSTLVLKAVLKVINNSSIKNSFNFTYKLQKYDVKDMLPVMFVIIQYGLHWRVADTYSFSWNTLYQTFIKLSNYGII